MRANRRLTGVIASIFVLTAAAPVHANDRGTRQGPADHAASAGQPATSSQASGRNRVVRSWRGMRPGTRRLIGGAAAVAAVKVGLHLTEGPRAIRRLGNSLGTAAAGGVVAGYGVLGASANLPVWRPDVWLGVGGAVAAVSLARAAMAVPKWLRYRHAQRQLSKGVALAVRAKLNRAPDAATPELPEYRPLLAQLGAAGAQDSTDAVYAIAHQHTTRAVVTGAALSQSVAAYALGMGAGLGNGVVMGLAAGTIGMLGGKVASVNFADDTLRRPVEPRPGQHLLAGLGGFGRRTGWVNRFLSRTNRRAISRTERRQVSLRHQLEGATDPGEEVALANEIQNSYVSPARYQVYKSVAGLTSYRTHFAVGEDGRLAPQSVLATTYDQNGETSGAYLRALTEGADPNFVDLSTVDAKTLRGLKPALQPFLPQS